MVMAGGIAMMVMALSNYNALSNARSLYYSEYRFADVFAQTKRAPLPLIGAIRAIPGVRNFGSHIGRAEVADEVVGPNFTELWISLDPSVPYEPTVARIQEVLRAQRDAGIAPVGRVPGVPRPQLRRARDRA